MTNPVQAITIPARRQGKTEFMAQQLKRREIPGTLTQADYAEAVDLLLTLAKTDCGGARVAAQVLLSTYNGNNWQCNLVDLTNLDAAHYRAAIIVIRGRVELNTEPQDMIADGNFLFAALGYDWRAYHVKNRHLQNEKK